MIQLGAFECSTLTAQPFGYEESETRFGRTAQRWSVSGLVDPGVWLELLDEYDTWRDLRIQDEDTVSSGVIGTTVEFSATGPGGQTWTDVECWFIAAPVGEQAGTKILVSFGLVDAAQALEVLLKEQEAEAAEDLPDFGTYTIGTTTLKLLKPVDGYRNGPAIQLTAGGTHYTTGPFVAEGIKDIEGTTDEAGWHAIRAWYENIVRTSAQAPGTMYPITPPQASAAIEVIEGTKTTVYTVTIQLIEVLEGGA